MKLKYKYLIYKVYSWRSDTPIVNTVLTLGTIHLAQLGIILLLIDRLITPLNWLYDAKRSVIFIGAIIYYILFYFIVYNKTRWAGYVDEYSKESDRERKKGNVLVITFLIANILLFLLSFPILFSIRKG